MWVRTLSAWPAKNERDRAGNNVTPSSVLCATFLMNERKSVWHKDEADVKDGRVTDECTTALQQSV